MGPKRDPYMRQAPHKSLVRTFLGVMFQQMKCIIITGKSFIYGFNWQTWYFIEIRMHKSIINHLEVCPRHGTRNFIAPKWWLY